MKLLYDLSDERGRKGKGVVVGVGGLEESREN